MHTRKPRYCATERCCRAPPFTTTFSPPPACQRQATQALPAMASCGRDGGQAGTAATLATRRGVVLSAHDTATDRSVVWNLCSGRVVEAAKHHFSLTRRQEEALRALLHEQDARMGKRVAAAVAANAQRLMKRHSPAVTPSAPPAGSPPGPVPLPAAVVARRPILHEVARHSAADVAEVLRLLRSFASGANQ